MRLYHRGRAARPVQGAAGVGPRAVRHEPHDMTTQSARMERQDVTMPSRESGGMNMRQLTVVLALASACIFITSCGKKGAPPPPVLTDVLDRLLLCHPAEINTAIGTTGIQVNGTSAVMFEQQCNIPDKDCRFNLSAQASVYDGSGWIAARNQYL